MKTKETESHVYYSDGRVYSKMYKKFMKFPVNSSGYPQSRLRINGVVRTVALHRLMAMNFIDNPENKREVNHIDGNKLNNDVSNLEWVTAKENIRHAIENNLTWHPKNEFSPRAKIKDWQVLAIRWFRDYYPKKYSENTLAKIYGISRSQVNKISNRTSRPL